MAQKSLTREEAVYTLVDGHFAIDCACGLGEDVDFRNHLHEDTDLQENYQLSNLERGRNLSHMFYMNHPVVESYLDTYHRKEEGKESLVIICKGCKNEIQLTYESYQEIIEKLSKE